MYISQGLVKVLRGLQFWATLSLCLGNASKYIAMWRVSQSGLGPVFKLGLMWCMSANSPLKSIYVSGKLTPDRCMNCYMQSK